MELKDIVLKKGDLIYFGNNLPEVIDYNYKSNVANAYLKENLLRITKIERPVKYETIYEAPKQILDKEEKEYLEAVIRPFRKKILYIRKSPQYEHDYSYNENIVFVLQNDDCGLLPYFTKDTMYKGMELDKEYTLEELGLFKGE